MLNRVNQLILSAIEILGTLTGAEDEMDILGLDTSNCAATPICCQCVIYVFSICYQCATNDLSMCYVLSNAVKVSSLCLLFTAANFPNSFKRFASIWALRASKQHHDVSKMIIWENIRDSSEFLAASDLAERFAKPFYELHTRFQCTEGKFQGLFVFIGSSWVFTTE